MSIFTQIRYELGSIINTTKMSYSIVKKIGKVSIELNAGNYRLRWSVGSRRFCLAIGKAGTDAALIAAEARAQGINSDILLGRFDESLARYSPKHAEKVAIAKNGLDLKEVWERYKSASQRRVAKTTQKDCWRTTDNCLAKLPTNLLLLGRGHYALQKLLEVYSVSTVKRTLSDINAACNWAVKAKLIESNPYGELGQELPKRQRSKRSRECLELKDVKAILKAFRADKNSTYYLNYVELLAMTGFRPEEAIALTWDDVICNEAGKTVLSINKAHSKGESKGTKTHDSRDFPCNPQLTDFLNNLPKLPNENNLLFPSPKGGYIDQHNFLSRHWRPIVKRLAKERKIKQYLPCYNLRHSFITRLIREGLDAATVARLVGNSPKMIFEHYLSANTDLELPEF